MTLQHAIEQLGGYRQVGRKLGISSTLAFRATRGEYPVRMSLAEFRAKINDLATAHGISAAQIQWPAPKGRDDRQPHEARVTQQFQELELMQLGKDVLDLFSLKANPFLNDVETDDDVYPFRGHQQVAEAIREAIDQRGFLAITGPSGAGKTTVWDGIESEYGMRDDVSICKPMLKQKEKMNPEHLARALIYGLQGDAVSVPTDRESRGRQLSAALRAIRSGSVDRKAVLYIDDAHFCNTSVLRQLKTFFEEKIGRFRLLAIILVGLPDLKAKLAAFPEIGNRIRLCEMPPVPVNEYLEFKLKRVGSSLPKLFDPAGLEAFLDRFRQPRRPAMGFPLIINASTIHAMCKLHQNGAQRGERITREIVDMLPGYSPARRIAS
jgi:type II secretory pathway predicted ATPase ExeA